MQTALSAKFLNLAFQVAGTTTVPRVSLLWEISAKNSDFDNPLSVRGPQEQVERLLSA